MTRRTLVTVALLALAVVSARAGDVGNPYARFGAGRYQAMAEGKACPPSRRERCIASIYGRESGPQTASGERFNPDRISCAHKTRPLGSVVTVTLLSSGHSIPCRINDRGPFVRGRCLDLSTAAARALGLSGVARVRVE